MSNIEKISDERSMGNGWFVHLKPGYAISDPDTVYAQHDFGEDTRSAAYRTARTAKNCSCNECKQG